MDSRISAVLRLVFVITALLAGGVMAMKHYRLHQEKKELVTLVRELTSEASFYRQFDRAGAERVLLRSVAAVEDARALGLPAGELFDRVYGREDKDKYDYRSVEQYPVREQLVRRTLDHAHRAADELGLLEPRPLRSLRDGEMPRLGDGRPVIVNLIDPGLLPGIGKVVPNLEIMPPGTEPGERELNAIEIAAARELARDLGDAKLIEESGSHRILEHYRTTDPDDS